MFVFLLVTIKVPRFESCEFRPGFRYFLAVAETLGEFRYVFGEFRYVFGEFRYVLGEFRYVMGEFLVLPDGFIAVG